jgi:integrase
MPRTIGKLTSRRVATAKPKRGRSALVLGDGGNLYLQCTLADDNTTVRRSWVFRFEINGKRREMGLGPTHTIGLAQARTRARALREQLLDNIDPLAAREADRRASLAAAAKSMTFRQCADAYMSLHSAGWGREHFDQWRRSLTSYVYPKLGDVPVAAIDQAAVMQLIEPLWTTVPTTAGRVRSRLEAVFDYASANGFRQGDNPARILAALPKKSKIAPVVHHPALPWQDIPQFMAELRALPSVAARCTEFLILTATRSGEALGARYDEIDLKAKVWVIPAERMKGRVEHRVPLSSAAVELLSGLQRTGPLVFGGSKALDDTALRRKVLARLRPGANRLTSSVTTHGMRAAFKTWCGESTNFANETVEIALAHRIGNKTEQAYERGDKFEKRRRLMEAWAKFCAEGAPVGDVVTMKRRAR